MKVLVVDDNRDAAMTLEMVISLMGHESRTAHDGLEALEVADGFAPDVVLLDLGMPRMDGFEACRRMRERSWGRRAVMIAITGWGQPEHIQQSEAAGFDVHLLKPVPPEVVAQTLDRVASRRGISSQDDQNA